MLGATLAQISLWRQEWLIFLEEVVRGRLTREGRREAYKAPCSVSAASALFVNAHCPGSQDGGLSLVLVWFWFGFGLALVWLWFV